MKIASTYRKYIYCLEGDWEDDLRDKASIRTALDFLHTNCNVKYIHRHCGTKESLIYYLNNWSSRSYKDYPICYLAFHGKPGSIRLNGKERLSLDELGEILKNKCKNKIIHFGCCESLNIDQSKLREFLEKTKALCVCGFQTEIDFLESSVFDMVVLYKFQDYKDIKALDQDLYKNYRKIRSKLNFKIAY